MTGFVVFASHRSAAASELCWESRLRYDSVQRTMHSSTCVRCSLSCKSVCSHTHAHQWQANDLSAVGGMQAPWSSYKLPRKPACAGKSHT